MVTRSIGVGFVYVHVIVCVVVMGVVMVDGFLTPDLDSLLSLFKDTKCKFDLEGHCDRGTVVVDPWIASTLKFQRGLQRDLPFIENNWVGTHNSYNNRADGYGLGDSVLKVVLKDVLGIQDDDINIAQQEYSLTDQLNFGVRQVMIDLFWFFDKLRMCHAGNTFPAVDRAIHYIEKVLNKTFDIDSDELGCSPFDRPVADAVNELGRWVHDPENAGEVISVFLNSDRDWDWGHYAPLLAQMKEVFGDALLLPSEVEGGLMGNIPSPAQLSAMGKRVILLGDGRYTTYGGEMIFLSTYVGYPTNDAIKFSREDCVLYFNVSGSCYSGESVVYGSIYNGPADMGLVTQDILQEMTRCDIKLIRLDQASPELVSSSVWTWALSEPSVADLKNALVVLRLPEQRWYTVSELSSELLGMEDETTAYQACQSLSNVRSWVIVARGAQSSCPDGYQASAPKTPAQQYYLVQQMLAQSITSVVLELP